MKKLYGFIVLLSCFFLTANLYAKPLPSLFLFLGGDLAEKHKRELKNSYVVGAQIIYTWKELEPQKNRYDFSKIKKDLVFLQNTHKKLFIQLQDRSFDLQTFNVPDYIRKESLYHGGVALQTDVTGEGTPIGYGWVARVWDPNVQKRFQLLTRELAKELDGKIYGINLPETAVDFDPNNLPKDFTYDNYFTAELENIKNLKEQFHKSIVVQYVNFFPGEWENDHHYMSRLFTFAAKHQIGLGGPDVLPYRRVQMKNSYPFFKQYKGKLTTAMAIQEPDYTYTNPKTREHYKFSNFYSFAKEYLGASILFWNVQEPFFSQQVMPKLNPKYWEEKADK